ncbi:MAG: Hpt domain-containing protein [Pseudomonadota bacterium]
MRLQDDIDFTTLSWVKQELDETLKQARQALEAYVEDATDASQMRFCATYLHQVQGTLRMVELYGAALVVEEMEQVALELLEDEISDREEAYAMLMRGIVQLPDYLERLQSGHRDIPVVLLPLLNDLRAARGQKLLSETALFSPDLTQPLPDSLASPSPELGERQLRVAAAKIRKAFEASLVQWFRADGDFGLIERLQSCCGKLLQVTHHEDGRRLWWVASGVFDGLRMGAVKPNGALKLLIGKIDRQIKGLALKGESFFDSGEAQELTRGLLYYAAHGGAGSQLIEDLKERYGLAALLPQAAELEHAQGAMSGHNRELLSTVSGAIKEDLMRVKDSLDLKVRRGDLTVEGFNEQGETLDRVADTLGMLGLGVPRKVVLEQREKVTDIVAGHVSIDEPLLLDIAGSLLYVEGSLDDHIDQLGSTSEGAVPAPDEEGEDGDSDGAAELPRSEVRRILDALMKEASGNLQIIKQNIVEFIEAPWDHKRIEDTPALLEEIVGALKMLDLTEAAELLGGIVAYTEVELLRRRTVPGAEDLDTIADAVASLEYYLEAVREHRPGRDKILEVARQSLTQLGYYGEEAIAERRSQPIEEAPPPEPPQASADEAVSESDPAEAEAAASDERSTDDLEPAESVELEAQNIETAAALTAAPRVAAADGPADISDDIDEEIRDVFIEEVEEELASLNELYPKWRSDTEDEQALGTLRRTFHTLKGSGRLVGALTIGEFSWQIENLFNRIIDGTVETSPQVLELLDNAVAAVPGLLAGVKGEGRSTQDIEAIKQVAERLAEGEQVSLSDVAGAPADEAAAPAYAEAVEAETEPSAEAELSVEAESAETIELEAASETAELDDEEISEAPEAEGLTPDLEEVTAAFEGLDLDLDLDAEDEADKAAPADGVGELEMLDDAAASLAAAEESFSPDDDLILVDDQEADPDVVEENAAPSAPLELSLEPLEGEEAADPSGAGDDAGRAVFDLGLEPDDGGVDQGQSLEAVTATGRPEPQPEELAADDETAEPVGDEAPEARDPAESDEPLDLDFLDLDTPDGEAAELAVSDEPDLGLEELSLDDLLADTPGDSDEGEAAEAASEEPAAETTAAEQDEAFDVSDLGFDDLPTEPGGAVVETPDNDDLSLDDLDLGDLTLEPDPDTEALPSEATEAEAAEVAEAEDDVEASADEEADLPTQKIRLDDLELVPLDDEASAAEDVPAGAVAEGEDAEAQDALAADDESDELSLVDFDDELSVGDEPSPDEAPVAAADDPILALGDGEDLSLVDFGEELTLDDDAVLGLERTADDVGDYDLESFLNEVAADDAMAELKSAGLAEPEPGDSPSTEADELSADDALDIDALLDSLPPEALEEAAEEAAAVPEDVLDDTTDAGDDLAPAEAELSASREAIDPVLRDILRTEIADHVVVLRRYLDDNQDAESPERVHEPLLRAVHTLNGAVSMVELPELAAVTAPLEGYVKRLHSAEDTPGESGLAALKETADLLDEVTQGLDSDALSLPDTRPLSERLTSLRDDLPSADGFNQLLDEESELASDDQPIPEGGFEDDLELISSLDFEGGADETASVSATDDAVLPTEADTITLEDGEPELLGEGDLAFDETTLLAAAEDAVEDSEAIAETVGRNDSAESEDASVDAAVEPEVQADEATPGEAAAEGTDDEGLPTDAVEEIEAEPETSDELAMDAAADDSAVEDESEPEAHDETVAEAEPEADQDAGETSLEDSAADDAEGLTESVEETLQDADAEDAAEATFDDVEAEAELEETTEAQAEAESEDEVDEEAEASVEAPSAEDEADQQAAEAIAELASDLEAWEEMAEAQGPVSVPDDETVALEDLGDIDDELLEIFLQEGAEILDESDHKMADWRENAENNEPVLELQRELHTLKGGARMAGLGPIGDLSHAMESLFEGVVEDRISVTDQTVEILEAAFDQLHQMLDQVSSREPIPTGKLSIARIEAVLSGRPLEELSPEAETSEAAEVVADDAEVAETTPAVEEEPEVVEAADDETPAAADDAELTAEPEPAPQVAPEIERPTALDQQAQRSGAPAARPQQELIRVRADLLDNLVNYAGEVSIYRSRLEQQIGTFRFNLVEFDQTVTRLREQLRNLEIETEAQILSRYQREAEELNETFDPLELDRFSTLQQLSRALAESVSDLVSIQSMLDDLTRQSETLLLQQSRVNSDLQEGLMRTRMVPFDSLVPRLRRILRQTTAELEKKAQLRVSGAQGEMDRTVLERITAPLEHILRNAVAHGLEGPEDRDRAGKTPEGTIQVNVAREATEVVITVSDDGGGVDHERVRAKAIERGMLKPDAELTDRDLYGFILETGFSTADEVTKVAGRGVGLDVVNSEIKQLGGSLDISSNQGQGTTFTIRLPFTLAVTHAIMVRVGDSTFAVPLTSIQGVVRMQRDEFDRRIEEGETSYSYTGEEYQLKELAVLLGLERRESADDDMTPVLMSRIGDQRAAIRVDAVLGSREIVVKSVGPQISSIPGIFGATILGDGSVIMILDLGPLVRRGAALRLGPDEAAAAPDEPAPQEVDRPPTIMVVDDSITMRKVTSRVLQRHAMEVTTAKDGVDAVEQLQDAVPDLMLLDIEMPRMDGFELATHMRNDERLKQVPIIMITSRTGDKHRDRAMEIGVNRYLGKPYQEAELLSNVRELLEEVKAAG